MKIAAAFLALTAFAHAAAPTITGPGNPNNGNVNDGATQINVTVGTGGLATRVTLKFGITPPLDPQKPLPGVQNDDVSATPDPQTRPFTLTGLVGGQKYAYTVEAVNADGSSGIITGTEFDVPKYKPTVQRGTPTTKSDGTATLKGSVIANGEDATVTFDYGKTTSYEIAKDLPSTPATVPAAGTTATAVTLDIGSLQRGVLYHYKIKAKNGPTPPVPPLGTSETPDATFTIAANKAPIAREDKVTLKGTESVMIDALKNDRDPEGDGFSLILVTQGKQGRAEIVGRQIKYTPQPGAKSGDTFTYTVKDDYPSSPKSAVGKVTITAPGLETRGNYSAQITDADGNVAGMVTLTGTGEGPVTGKVHLYNKTYTVRGNVDENGHFYYTIPREGGSPIQLDANFTGDATKNFTADLSSGSDKWTADSTLYALTNARRDEIVGKYTVQLPGGGDTDAPKGTGYARLDVKPWGEVAIAGRFGDGGKFSTKGVLTGTDAAPIVTMWATPKNARVDATFNFGAGTSPDITGSMKWYRPPDGDAQFFPTGFYTVGSPTGARYEPPLENQRALEVAGGNAKTATLTLSDGNITGNITQQVTLSKNDKVNFDSASPYGLTLKIDRDAGTFKGEFDHPFDNSRRKFNGVLVQSAGNGKGVFIGIDQTGTAALTIGAAPTPQQPQQPQQPNPDNGGNNGGNNGNINVPGVGNIQIPAGVKAAR